MHWLVDGQAIAVMPPLPSATGVGAGLSGEAGSKVSSKPSESTAVHWLVVGHATAPSELPSSIVTGSGAVEDVGLNVISRPKLSTAVH